MSFFRTISSSTCVTSDVQSIYIPSSVQDWYREDTIWATDRQFLSACGSHGQRTQGSWDDRPGSTASCTIHAQSVEETSKLGVLGRHQPCSEKGIEVLSDTIERHHSSRNTPILLYPESCSGGNWRSHIRESICVTSASSKDFLETWLDERIGFRSCSTTRRRSCSTIQMFLPNWTNQIQTEITIERGDPLFAVMKITSAQPLFDVSKSLIHVSLVKVRTYYLKNMWITIERRDPLFAVMQLTSAQC